MAASPHLWPIITALLLTACGGGNNAGSDHPSIDPSPPDLSAAIGSGNVRDLPANATPTHLLQAALDLASHRVVVKRPRKAPPIEGRMPGYVLEGKSSRYDIYPRKSLK